MTKPNDGGPAFPSMDYVRLATGRRLQDLRDGQVMTTPTQAVTIEEVVRFRGAETDYIEVDHRGAWFTAPFERIDVERLELFAEAIALAIQHMRRGS